MVVTGLGGALQPSFYFLSRSQSSSNMATITSPRTDPIQRITSPSISSANGTPTSSVRPSLELPRANGPLSPATQQNAAPIAATAQRRNRAALRDYYNLKAKAPRTGVGPEQRNITRTASVTSIASDSTITSSTAVPESTASVLSAQLDEPSFAADKYVTELLKTASLQDLLKTEGALVSEVRNLDGERKALVYDNYSKLIKAVGTIAEMQKGMHKNGEQDRFASMLARQRDRQPAGLDGVKEGGEQLDGLLRIMKELNPGKRESAKEVVESRRQRRQKETVNWALSVPDRLQRLLDGEQWDEAENLHTSLTEVLRHWEGVAGVDELRRTCAEIMESTKDKADEESKDDAG